jgi:5-methylcytosine-specific restriction protein B
MLEKTVHDNLKRRYEQLLEQEQLLSLEKLQEYYATFREHFAPDKLRQLDGEELLNTIHAHGNQDSLVYWLEFKNDDEFPAGFGSIAGGSALKFGIYRRKETGAWMTGTATSQKEISVAEAIAIARKHRDQLVAGAKLLEELAPDSSDENYAKLQDGMEADAPDVNNTAWGHKYFSLIYPTKLDDFHVEEFQRFHIRKMLQVPPSRDGRYAAAGRYVSAAAELQIPIHHLATILNRTNGRPYKIWRVGTKLGGTDDIWPIMREEKCAAIGWENITNLSGLVDDPNRKDKIRKQLEADGYIPNVASRHANEISSFVTRINEGDVIVAADGEKILGLGKVTGPYEYKGADSHGAPHRRPVKWIDTQAWKLPETEGLQSTVRQLNKYPVNLVEIERRLSSVSPGEPAQPTANISCALRELEDIPRRIQAVLERKGQVILHGPPGTGKTYWAYSTARQLAAHAAFRMNFEELDSSKQAEVTGSHTSEGLVRTCTFHPAYGYEDFIEGYRPVTSAAGQLSFDLREGIFKRLCKDAEKATDRHFFLVIDEINRGDIPRIFGELITLLELDKRGTSVHLTVSGEPFTVPKNIHVIGTMNTADRSIALLDTALRRRFGFIELMPDLLALGKAQVANSIPLGPWLSALNERVRNHVRRDARNLQVGHAYFMESDKPVTDFGRFSRILAEDIFPLLEEYCYENYGILRQLLGQALVDEQNQRIRDELFTPERRDDLIQALLSPFPEIATSTAAIVGEHMEPEADSDEAPEESA